MTLHFETAEFDRRVAKARQGLAERGLAAILLFAQESHYYLSGYDTTGYVFFQCLVLTADQQPLTLLTRRPDLEQARRTSIIDDIRIWYDREDASPTDELRDILAEKGLAGACIGIELDSYGLRAHDYEQLKTSLDGWCELEDASALVRGLRLIKSGAELDYVRRAAELADASLLAMLDTAGPGAFEGDIAAAGTGAILSGGGDPAPSGPVLGSGERALLIRSATGFRHLDEQDQLTMEFAGSYRHYCACLMRTVAIGSGSEKHRQMFQITQDALSAMTEAARPGRPLGEIDDAHRRVYDENGYGDVRMAACGYSLGASFRPTWMDVPPMLFSGNPLSAQPGMVLFLHAILIDSPANLAMSLGHTIIITENSADVLSRLEPDYIICA
ncbi:MAG: aminopeptidase P family protein [Rhodospirillaceae bacterium]|jgi:Xaa-Pro dipeptidase|nr:aminopeptidase P family protein [Rhodospirillaceae bacterium]MBT3491435.1 aminopeptidase P family protein [Rhodospirillaceae bacterium]MBT3781456.1 aminopeptidase P family protein [Rhodospirillaceae bacterium]MBT3976435.1 aminopeptidase P family protein [Rhodospirillaceae bacterium]MBT4564505.1 aminopeptidase P family protein [Rhodospirillaceae bacterium]